MLFYSTFLVIILSRFSSANIWDNIFGNYNAPLVYIPPDFHVLMGISRVDSPYILDIDYSTKQKSMKIVGRVMNFIKQGKMKIQEILKDIGTLHLNLTEGKAYLHTSSQQCLVYQGINQLNEAPQLSNKLNSKSNSFNKSLEIVDPNTIFQLISFYKGTSDDGLIQYDMSSLFQNGNRVFAMFDPKTKQLDSIEFDIANQKLTLYALGPLEIKQYEGSYFKVPIQWDCSNIKNQVDFSGKTLEQLMTELVTSTVKQELLDQIKQTLNENLN